MCKKITRLFIILLAAAPFSAFAQFTEKLESAVVLYNGLRDKTYASLSSREQVAKAEQAEALLNEVARGGSAEEQKTARYFLAVTTKLRGEMYYRDDIKDMKKVGTILKSVATDFESLEPSIFPFRYKFQDKNFIIKYTDFEYTRRQFYGELAEIYYRDSDTPNFEKYAKKSLDIVIEGEYFIPFITHYFAFFIHKTPEQKNEDLRKAIGQYSLMSATGKQEADQNGGGETFIKKYLDYLLINKKAPENWDKSGTESLAVAASLDKADLDSVACILYRQGLDKGASLSYDQNWQVLQLFLDNGFKSEGIRLANKVLPGIAASNCTDLERLATYFTKFGDTVKGGAVAKSAQKCREDVLRREQEAEKRRQKEIRRNSRNRVYLGAYVLRIVQRPQYIDLGGVLDIPAGKSARMEFSYMHARNDQDYMLIERIKDSGAFSSDYKNPHWDGFYAHFGYKKMERSYHSRSSAYRGFLLTYNQRNFQPAFTDVVEESSGTTVASGASFEPRLTSYGFMLNMGSLWLGKGIGRDFYMGMGATYNRFDLNNTQWPNAQYNYTNPLLGMRKETFFGFQIRIGMTLGLSL